MIPRWAVVLAAAALVAPPLPASAAVYRDAVLGFSLDLGADWEVTARPEGKFSEEIGKAPLALARGEARGWMLFFNALPELVGDAERQREGLATIAKARYVEAGERFLPGTFRNAEFGRASGVFLEFEAAPADGKGRTRAGRAALAVGPEGFFVLVVEHPAAGATVEALREMERLVLSLRAGLPRGGAPADAKPSVADAVPTGLSGDPLPEGEFRAAVEMKKVATLPSGLELFRQYYLMEGGKLPPFVTHLMGKEYEMEGRKGRTPDLVLLLCNNTKGKAAATLRAEVEIPGFAAPASRTVTVPAGESVVATFSPVFADALFDLVEQRPGAVRLRVFEAAAREPGLLDRVLKRAPERTVLDETQRILLLSRNDFFWRDTTGRSWAPAIAAFVTPHDQGRRIDGLLRKAAELCPLKAMVGYQEAPGSSRVEVVEAQVGAVYDAIAAGGLRYVNAPFSIDARAQRIKFPAQSLEDGAGNCIEVAVLFASAFEAMGMRAVILLYAGHAQVGVRAWADDAALVVLEGTMCGSAPYAAARKEGDRLFREGAEGGKPPQVLDIRELRKIGFTPVPR